MADALVLAGAVEKGAFTAGALAALAEQTMAQRIGLDVRRIVAVSSGALNGAFYAAAVRNGNEATAGAELERIWIDEATFTQGFAVSAHAILGERGLSSSDNLLDVLRRHIPPSPETGRDIELRLIISTLRGDLRELDGRPASTFESVRAFNSATYATRDGLEPMFRAVTASAAFPGAFEPVLLDIDGEPHDCVDGGATSNAPIQEALEGDARIDRVFLITPYPRVARQPNGLRGLAFIARLADVLIQERLYRDLEDVYARNAALARLEERVPDEDERQVIFDCLGWTRRRRVQVVEVRPDGELDGNAFTGLFSRTLREDYVRAGRAAVRALSLG